MDECSSSRYHYNLSSDSDEYHSTVDDSFSMESFHWMSSLSDASDLSSEIDLEMNLESKSNESMSVYRKFKWESETLDNVDPCTNDLHNCGNNLPGQNQCSTTDNVEHYTNDLDSYGNNLPGQNQCSTTDNVVHYTNDLDSYLPAQNQCSTTEGDGDKQSTFVRHREVDNAIRYAPSDESVNKSTTTHLKRRLSDESDCAGKVPKKKKPKRNCRSCPIKGCTASNLVKLSQHLLQSHQITDKAKRIKILQKTCKVQTLLVCVCTRACVCVHVHLCMTRYVPIAPFSYSHSD